MKKLCIGILAHVDAGKTTLSEALLYNAHAIKSLGRVDKRDTYLDTDDIERRRGITVFSKPARFTYKDISFILIDTPGHVDFSAEMERTLQILDYAILIISAPEGIQSHTKTLWKLLKTYNIPTYVFINKLDMVEKACDELICDMRKGIDANFINFSDTLSDDDYENIAVSDEKLLEQYLNGYTISGEDIVGLIKERKLFPCVAGSALRLSNINRLLDVICEYSIYNTYSDNFSAYVYKISRDNDNSRLSHLKITGGTLNVRDVLGEEKVSQLRLYSGEKYEAVQAVSAGDVCSVPGLNNTFAGQLLGDSETDTILPVIEPVLNYYMLVPEDIDSRRIYPDIQALGEELPELDVIWDERTEQIIVKLMGPVQLEIITSIISKRFGFTPSFSMGGIEYKETITDAVIGVGHFEPLRHYAEVHLLLEPQEAGTGIIYDSNCSTDVLAANWQKHILSSLSRKAHRGVLTGAMLTDVKITVINGRAHDKHTVGGDFRQASYRAVRQGLMKTHSKLLEPYYDFMLELPADMLGKAMTDLDMLSCVISTPDTIGDTAYLSGYGPVATLRDYQENISAYTRGLGSISCSYKGYFDCHNEDEVLSKSVYDPDSDLNNMSSSVFCAHGAGFIVPWYEVEEYMHVSDDEAHSDISDRDIIKPERFDYSIGTDEIDAIINKTAYSNIKESKHIRKKKISEPDYKVRTYKPKPVLPKLLIVDGYNVIFAWDKLKELANINMDSAKDALIADMSNYQSMSDYSVMVVFDGYKVVGNTGSDVTTGDIRVIHTKEGETADQYIEKFTKSNISCYNISVVSSDRLIQQITTGHDCRVISSRELKELVDDGIKKLREDYLS